jgi:hypothetical protein
LQHPGKGAKESMRIAARRNMGKPFLSILFVLTVCETLGGAVAFEHNSLMQTSAVRIVPTSYLDLVADKLKQPRVTTEEAVEFANSLLAIHGFDYWFDACPVVNANPHPQSIKNEYGLTKGYNYSFVQTNGRRIKMQLIGDPTNALCSQCKFDIPLLRVTKQQLLVVSDGKQYLVKRPPGFFLKEISLVDRSMKRILRTWEVPLDTQLAGISEDGTIIYIELLNNYTEDLINRIVVEVSGSTIRFRALNKVAVRDGEFVKDHPTDPRDSYRTFKRFRIGDKQYIIRYDLPCT